MDLFASLNEAWTMTTFFKLFHDFASESVLFIIENMQQLQHLKACTSAIREANLSKTEWWFPHRVNAAGIMTGRSLFGVP